MCLGRYNLFVEAVWNQSMANITYYGKLLSHKIHSTNIVFNGILLQESDWIFVYYFCTIIFPQGYNGQKGWL